VPNDPDWPGLDAFGGASFHTARWDHAQDLTGKVVAVVGTGSTACQVIPAIRTGADKVIVFQREPGWVLPKGEREITAAERTSLARPGRRRVDRIQRRWTLERNLWGGAMFRPGTALNRKRERTCRAYIDCEFAERPDLRAAVTPGYPFPGKRPILATTYYPALKEPNVELVTRAVARVTPTGIIDSAGIERPVDVIVLATGFRAADYLARVEIVGKGGRTLQDHWGGEPRAFLGITVPGFPNLFLLYGPGTNGGELVSMLESQAEFAVRAVKWMRREGVSAVEVRRSFDDLWNRWLQSRMSGTSWTLTRNYFTSRSGRVVTQWPSGNMVYRALTKLLGRISETTSRRPIP
jgi:cation diffusion facilitator CzcD-associated flavoprotein CzcO